MSMTLIVVSLLALVLLLTTLGLLFNELKFSERPGWQNFTCRMTLLGSVSIPLTLLAAMLWLPGGLIHLPILNSGQDVTQSGGLDPIVDASATQSTAAKSGMADTNESHSADPVKSSDAKSGRPESTSPGKQKSRTADGTKSATPGSHAGATLKPGIDGEGEFGRQTESGANRDGGQGYLGTSSSLLIGWLGLVWLSGSLLLATYLTIGLFALQRLRRSARPLNSTRWNIVAARMGRNLNLSQPIFIATSPIVSTPLVVGITRPTVLVPEAMADCSGRSACDEQKIEAILGHELMHVKRRDTFWNLISFVALLLWWPVPTLHWVRSRMAWSSELLCDAHAVSQVGGTNYAETLLQLSLLPFQQRYGALSLSMQPTASTLERRVHWILEHSLSVAGAPGIGLKRVAWVCLALLLIASATLRLVPVANEGHDSPANALANASVQEQQPHVRGTVSKAEGIPVANATVYLVEVPKQQWRLPVEHVNCQSDAAGEFDFADVPPGNYMLWAEGDGLTSLKKMLQGKRVTVGQQTGPEPVSLQMIPGCNYEVSVVSAIDNSPIENAEITFGWTDIDRSYRTDETGIARIGGLAPHTWHFIIRAEGFATTFNKSALQTSGSTTEVQFELQPGASIRGAVVDEEGFPIADSTVYCGSNEAVMSPGFARVQTDMQGEFEISGLPTHHQLVLSVSPDSHQRQRIEPTLEEAGSVTEFELVCKKIPYGGDVVLTVLGEDGTPVEGAEVFNRGTASNDVRSAVTDSEGKARLVDMYHFEDLCNVVVRAKGKVPTAFLMESGSQKKTRPADRHFGRWKIVERSGRNP